MDENVPPNLIIDLVLKGGPPWGFRIKEKHNTVIISKVNCGRPASKIGLRLNDEIIAVNNLEIDKHPLTLDIQNKNDDLMLTKLDFTYQLIKHTINHNLHLKVKRTNFGEQSQFCCYPHTDDEDEQKTEDDSKQSNGNERRRSELHGFTNFNGTCIHQQQAMQTSQQANGGVHHANGVLKAANQLHHPFTEYCLNAKTNGEELVLSPGDEFNVAIEQRPQTNYSQFIANLNPPLNSTINGNATQFHANNLKEQTLNTFQANIHHHPLAQANTAQTQNQMVTGQTECSFIHPTIFTAAQNMPANQFNQPNIICTPAPPDQQPPPTATTTTTIVQQPLQLLIDDQSDLNTTDINMDSSPCSEIASDLNLKQFSSRSHKDVWSPGSTTTSAGSTGSNSSCDMHSDSTIKDSVPVILPADPTLSSLFPSSNLANVNNLSLKNIGEMNMVLELGRLDLSNIQQQQQLQQQQLQQQQLQQQQQNLQQQQIQQANQMNQMNSIGQINQMNQPIGQQIATNLQSQSNVQLAGQTDPNLLVQQQLLTQPANQSTQLQAGLPGYFLSNNVTPIANNIRPLVLDHNNNAVDLNTFNQFNQRSNEQILTNELSNRIISPSTQSEASTNTQISKKIGIRVGSPPPEGQFKCWTLPRYVQQPFTQLQTNAAQRYTPQYMMNYNGQQFSSSNQASMSTRKQMDAQQFASQILYTKSNQTNSGLESPQSNSQPDLIQPDHSITPTPQQQHLNYYPSIHMRLEQAGLPDSYAKFCYETATHKYYTIPASVAQRGSVLSLIAPPPSRYSDRSIKRRKQRRKQLKMSKSLNKQISDDESSGEESESELLDVNDGDDEIDLKMLRDESDDDKEISSDEDADNEEIEQMERSEQETVKSTNQPQSSSKTTVDRQSRKESQKASDLNASTEQTMEDERTIETNLDESDEKSKTDKDNKRKKLSSQFVSSKKSKKSVKKSIKKRPTSRSETEIEQMSTNELLKSKLRQVKKKFELVNLLNDEEKKHTGKIADYLPGRSSVLVREKQKFYANLISYIDSIFNEVFSSTESLSDYENVNDRRTAMSMGKIEDAHHLSKAKEQQRRKRHQQLRKLQRHHQHSILSKNCAFNVLISDDTTTTNGYESDSSYIVRRREPIPAPVSRSVYSSVQRGEDIPFEGLRRLMPYIRTKDEKFRKQSSLDSRDNIPTDQLNRFIDKELDWINHETNLMAQRRHHFNISPQHQILSFNRYKYAAASKSSSELSKSLLAKVLYDFRAVYGRDLSVKKGDIVIVIRSVNNNWVEVEDIENGLKGLVPRNFIEYEQEGIAKAKYDFDAKTGVEVSFKKDEILRLIRKVDNNWFEGLNSRNESGIIPINYIEVMRLPLRQSTTPQSHQYTRSVISTPQSSTYFSSNVRARQIGSHPNLSIEPIIESDSANSSSNNHQLSQPPNSSFFYSRSSSAMCQNKTLAAQQKSSIEHFSQKASLAASAPHLIDDVEQIQTADKQQQTGQSVSVSTNTTIATNNQSQQTATQQQQSSGQQTNNQQNAPLHPPLPLQSDFASTTSIATSSNMSQLPADNNYALRNQLYPTQQYQQYLLHPRNHLTINNNLNKRPPPHNMVSATNNSRMALKRLYRVMYPYEPLQSDELRLIAGDIVSVSTHCDDGWFIGFSSLTGLSGIFPGNYVCPLH